jgi:two-component system sensor histidine kinase ChiS
VKTHLELKFARDALENQNEILEQKVKERTVELVDLNTTLESFVPREFLSLLNKESILEINLGDQIKQEMTIMFADIRGWTSLSENMTPQENFNFINAYLRRVSPVIKRHNGFIDQYYGDGLMALFPGTPEDAVMAAIAMHMAVEEYNKEREKEGFKPIGIGVGLHVGELMVGIIGSEERMQGAVVADAVNLAARLEALTMIYGSSITLSEPTLSTLKDPDKYKHRFVDKVRVKGKKAHVSVHEVFNADPKRVAELKERTKANFEEGLRLYYETKFSKASVQFNQVLEENPEDKAARIYLKRCANYMVQGVPEGWTGVESLTKK